MKKDSAYSSNRPNPFTVVTPNYNMAGFLAQTIESVLSNLEPGDEYFVIDGGSDDNSIEVIRRYERQLSGWVSEPDRGYADALAKGFARGTAPWQCWINSGDLLLAGALDTARALLSQGSADMVFGDDFYIDERGRVISFSRGQVRSLRDAMLYAAWTPLQDACFWSRELYQRAGGLDRSLRHAADFDLFLRFAISGRVRYVAAAFSAFRRHPGQKSITQSEAYRAERQQCRARALASLGESGLRGTLRSLWHGAAIRFRIHLQQRFWKLPHLVGTPVTSLVCKDYWQNREVLI
jgi:glycosyltransferase involved in cell wall biosynthesis